MEVQEALTMRKSTRAFTEQKVDRSLIRTIIKRAGMAPSGVNTQPWEVAIVSGKTRARLVSTVEQAFRDGISGKMDYQYYPYKWQGEFKKRRPDIVREILGYSDDKILICGMALGYEDTKVPINSYRTPREPVENYIRFFS